MDNLLQGIPGVCMCLDDILVTGRTMEDHLDHLDAVFTHLWEAGMKLKKEKCQFLMPKVEYLDHVISSNGLEPSPSNVAAIVNAPAPRDVFGLKSLLGLVNYYGKFLPDRLVPLYKLLQKGVKWEWKQEQVTALARMRDALQSPNLLTHYDPNQLLVLACDASPFGLEAVVSHRFSDGTEKPISFASRTLATAERKYSQLDKEALAIIFGVKHFNQYLYGREFTILSDHKPLKHIFSQSKATPAIALARIQRWAILLGGYHYTIECKPGPSNANADTFSRLPLAIHPQEVPVSPEVVHLMERLEITPASASQVCMQTARDPLLSKVKRYIMLGWPLTKKLPPELLPFLKRKDKLSIQDDCLMWGGRVVVPFKLQKKVTDELHAMHPGISRMKSLARQHVWWPGIDLDLEKMVKGCSVFQITHHNPPAALLHPWE